MKKFQVISISEFYENFSPGDGVIETFVIQNNSDTPMQIRLQIVSNVENSILFPVLQAGWFSEDTPINLSSFHDLSSEWYSLDGNSRLSLELYIYFPKELGNAYQGKSLNACFTFEGRSFASDQSDVPAFHITNSSKDTTISSGTTTKPPATGDSSLIVSLFAVQFLCLIILIILIRKKKGI